MEHTKVVLKSIYSLSFRALSEYYGQLDGYGKVEQKKCIAEYYMFCVRLLALMKELEGATHEISKQILECDRRNDFDRRDLLSEYFEHAICFRKMLDEFLSNSENAVKQTDGRFLYALKLQTDMAIRKANIFITDI